MALTPLKKGSEAPYYKHNMHLLELCFIYYYIYIFSTYVVLHVDYLMHIKRTYKVER